MVFTAIKLIFSNTVGLLFKHWRIVLPLLLAWLAYSYVTSLIDRAATAENKAATIQKNFTDYQNDIFKLTVKRLDENRIAKATAKAELAASERKSNVLAKLNLDRERETQNLKDQYENRINSIKYNWSQRLRIESSKNERSSAGVPDIASDTSGLAEGWRECDGAYSTLEKACQITTSDYNRLRGWADVACKQVGCDEF